MTSFDAAVIGSGPNGLAAAIVLATAGRSVVVLEGADQLGGSARTAELTLPGFRHDVCSAIHPMALGTPLLPSLELERYGLEWIQPPAAVAHPMDDPRAPAALLYPDLERTASELGADGGAWRRTLGYYAGRWDELVADAVAPPGLPRSPLLMARFGAHALLPAAVFARRMFREAPARALFAGIAAHSVLPLTRAPSSAVGLMLGAAGHAVGWPLPRGGAQAISDALAAHLRSLGGEIRVGVTIRALAEVPTDGPVLFDTSPAAMAGIAGDALPARFRDRLCRFRHGPGVCKVDWALDGPIPWRDPRVAEAGTVHLGGGLDALIAAEQAPWSGRHAERPYVLLAQQSLFDDSRAPEGRHTGWAYCHVPSGSTGDRSEVIEAAVEAHAPGFRDRILARSVMTAADFQSYNPNYVGGDVNGGASDLDQLLTRPVVRWSPYTTPNPRLYLCSASTPPGGGVHGMCGFYAAQAAMR